MVLEGRSGGRRIHAEGTRRLYGYLNRFTSLGGCGTLSKMNEFHVCTGKVLLWNSRACHRELP